MPKFKYTANDATGGVVTGWIHADDPQEAQRLLTSADGALRNIVLAEVPVELPEVAEEEKPVLAEAVEVATVVAEEVHPEPAEAELDEIASEEIEEIQDVQADESEEASPTDVFPSVRAMPILEDADRLIQQGVPLGSGLRAIAEELPSGRNATAIRALAKRLDMGESLHEAMVKLRFAVPSSLRNLLESGVSTGRFSVVLHQLVQLEQERRQLWQKSFSVMAYPIFLLSFLAFISMALGLWLIPEFQAIFRDFGTELPSLTQMIIGFFCIGQWVLWGILTFSILLFFTIDVLPVPRFVKRMAYWVPLVGPIRRWHRLTRCTRVMALLTREQIPLPTAIRIAAEATGHNEVAKACRVSADRVEHGLPFSYAADQLRLFPPSCMSIIWWGEKNNALPEAFQIVSEVAKTRMQAASDLLNVLASPIILMVFLVAIPITVIGLFMPLIKLITTLS